MNEKSSYDKIEAVLFKPRGEAAQQLTRQELGKKERWMLCVSKLLDNPLTEDRDLVCFLMNGCGGACEKVSQATAYRDVAAVKRLVGNIQLSSKNWYRHLIIESAKRGIAIAESEKDAKGIAVNIDKIGKYTRADKEDEDNDRTGWQPPVFEPTDDVTLLGDNFKPIHDLERERAAFRALFKRSADVQDVEPTPIDDGTGED